MPGTGKYKAPRILPAAELSPGGAWKWMDALSSAHHELCTRCSEVVAALHP
jgi:hypothetical protein